jgi:hypothetical protein
MAEPEGSIIAGLNQVRSTGILQDTFNDIDLTIIDCRQQRRIKGSTDDCRKPQLGDNFR